MMEIVKLTRRQIVGVASLLSALMASAIAATKPGGLDASEGGPAGSAGRQCYPRTPEEASVHVEPSNYAYPFGNVMRYGAVGDGKVDDSAAIEKTLQLVNRFGALVIVFPGEHTFKITRYLEIFSNTSIHLYGKLQLTGRASGLFANGASNVGINGFNIGDVQDATVASSYVWNPGGVIAPAIHLRSVTNVIVEGINFSHVSQGILVSDADNNMSARGGGHWSLTQTRPSQVKLRNNTFNYTEYSALSCYSGSFISYDGNYVYRSGDGGIWHMGSTDSEVVNNTRISPQTTPADVASHGSNRPNFPTTWNDEQGLSFEACHGLLIANNVVQNFANFPIDIKNNCNRVLVTGNRISNCQSTSISTRGGDAIKNACTKISIVKNTIANHGTPQYPTHLGTQGAIRVGETYIAEILDNVIYAYEATIGINCEGAASYLTESFPNNPHQSSVVVSGNVFDFKSPAFESEVEIGYVGETATAIRVTGLYDSVRVTNNKISADYHGGADSRRSTVPAILLTYAAASESFYPTNAKIDGNTISGWAGAGIRVVGLDMVVASNLSISNNSLGVIGSTPFIDVYATHYAIIAGNSLSQCNFNPGPGILLAGVSGRLLKGAIVTNNAISGGWETGADSLNFGISFDYCCDCIGSNNRIINASGGAVRVLNSEGDVVLSGTTGFPRSGGTSPNGSLRAYWLGETFWDATNRNWWVASAAQSTTWSRLG